MSSNDNIGEQLEAHNILALKCPYLVIMSANTAPATRATRSNVTLPICFLGKD
jgi:hypothetical protein